MHERVAETECWNPTPAMIVSHSAPPLKFEMTSLSSIHVGYMVRDGVLQQSSFYQHRESLILGIWASPTLLVVPLLCVHGACLNQHASMDQFHRSHWSVILQIFCGNAITRLQFWGSLAWVYTQIQSIHDIIIGLVTSPPLAQVTWWQIHSVACVFNHNLILHHLISTPVWLLAHMPSQLYDPTLGTPSKTECHATWCHAFPCKPPYLHTPFWINHYGGYYATLDLLSWLHHSHIP